MSQGNKSPEQMLEEAQIVVGKWAEGIVQKYPVEYEPIARYCRMVDDNNPLFIDPEYARRTKFGDVIAPPFAVFGIMMDGFDKIMWSRMPKTPGPFVINMRQEYEFYRPLVVDDRVTFFSRVAKVKQKAMKMDPKAWLIVLEFLYKNQRGEEVCLVRNVVMSHRSPEEVAQDT